MSRWGSTWPGGIPSWYIFESDEGLAIWPPDPCPTLTVPAASKLHEILTRWLVSEGWSPPYADDRDRRELDGLREACAWIANFYGRYGFPRDAEEWVAQRVELERRLADVEAERTEWRNRAFRSERAFSRLRDLVKRTRASKGASGE